MQCFTGSTHHVTQDADHALVRSQWLIAGTRADGTWVFYIDRPAHQVCVR